MKRLIVGRRLTVNRKVKIIEIALCDMNKKYPVLILFSIAFFLLGGLISHFLNVSNWSDARLVVSLSTGAGYLLGYFLSNKIQ